MFEEQNQSSSIYSGFKNLPRSEAEELFLGMEAAGQAELINSMPSMERRSWVRLLAPDDAADLIQQTASESQTELIDLLDRVTKKEVQALLAYAEDEAGGLMSPRFARVRPDMHVDEALSYVRRQARRQVETISYLYVLDENQCLLGVVSLRELFTAEPTTSVREVMNVGVITANENTKQSEVAKLLKDNDLVALPIVDEGNHLKGIVTVDDVIDVLEEEVTEDIQKIGGMQALDSPYPLIEFWEMVKRRGGWLAALFVGEMLTATAMAYYQAEIASAVVLALFIPLIISSGGNSGSQASTLVIRSLALGEIQLRDWPKILLRELGAGICLGAILALIAFFRISIWSYFGFSYGDHYMLLATAVSISLVCVVITGTVTGAMLPFILSRLKLDPASASAPFVATIVDVAGLMIYFTVAALILHGTIL